MQSNINQYINKLSERHDEISLLITHAESLSHTLDSNSEKLYISICRSISILLVSHLEGFIKDFTKELILDINQFIPFKDINAKVKRQYVSSFLSKPPKEQAKLYNQQIKELTKKFENIDDNLDLSEGQHIKLSHEPFLHKDNKNPKANVLFYICKNFGIDNIFAYLKNSELEIVFENDRVEIDNLINEIQEKLHNSTENYPFVINYDEYNLEKSAMTRDEKTNWELFLEDLLNTRHKIVHGVTLENMKNHNELKIFEQKTILIQYSIMLLLIEKNFTLEVI